MPAVWKSKKRPGYFTILFFRVNTTRRNFWPDRWNSITIPWGEERRVIWERAK